MPGLSWRVKMYVCCSWVNRRTDCLTLPSSSTHTFSPCFQPLNSVELIVLNAQTHATVLQVCFHSNNFSDACEALNKGLQRALCVDTWRSCS